MKRRPRRLVDFRTDIGTGHRIDLGGRIVDAPIGKRADIVLVEGDKAGFAERLRRTQLAGAKRRHRPAGGADDSLDPAKSLGKRHRTTEAHPFDLKAGLRGHAAGVLKHPGDVAIAARCKDFSAHGRPSSC
jgi:hypothetical protein